MLWRTQGTSTLRLDIISHRENSVVVLSVPEEKHQFLYLRKGFSIVKSKKCKVLLWIQNIHFGEKMLWELLIKEILISPSVVREDFFEFLLIDVTFYSVITTQNWIPVQDFRFQGMNGKTMDRLIKMSCCNFYFFLMLQMCWLKKTMLIFMIINGFRLYEMDEQAKESL